MNHKYNAIDNKSLLRDANKSFPFDNSRALNEFSVLLDNLLSDLKETHKTTDKHVHKVSKKSKNLVR